MYTRSNNIKVFPSNKREKEYINYSGLNTEQNIVSLVNRFTRNESYVEECVFGGDIIDNDITIEGYTSYLKADSKIKAGSTIQGENLDSDTDISECINLNYEDEIISGSSIGAFSFINGEFTKTTLSGKFNICGYYFDIHEPIDITSELENKNYLYLKMNTVNDVKNNISSLRLDGTDILLPSEEENDSKYSGLEIIGSINQLINTDYQKYLKIAEKKNNE